MLEKELFVCSLKEKVNDFLTFYGRLFLNNVKEIIFVDYSISLMINMIIKCPLKELSNILCLLNIIVFKGSWSKRFYRLEFWLEQVYIGWCILVQPIAWKHPYFLPFPSTYKYHTKLLLSTQSEYMILDVEKYPFYRKPNIDDFRSFQPSIARYEHQNLFAKNLGLQE